MNDSCLAILAGGDGKRLGYYKPLMNLNNKKLVVHTLDNLGPYFNYIILVVKNNTQKELLISSIYEAINKYNVEVVVDKVNLNGPIAGLVTAVDYCNRKLLAIAPSDTPFIKFSIYKHLGDYVVNKNYEAAVPAWPNNYIEPLISISVRDKIAQVLNKNIREGKLRIRDVYAEMRTAYVNVYYLSKNPDLEFFNVNNNEDLELARRIVSQLN
ncbi:MAG: molybdenum cofactor guanylyltransferase [Thermosphaera sp.]